MAAVWELAPEDCRDFAFGISRQPPEAIDQSFVDMTEARAKGATLPKSYKPMHQVDAAKDLRFLVARWLAYFIS